MLICLLLRSLEKEIAEKAFSPFLATAGVLLIALPGEFLMNVDTESNFQKGLIFSLFSGLSLGTTIIPVRYLRYDYIGIIQTFWMTGISLLIMLPPAFLTPLSLFFKNI